MKAATPTVEDLLFLELRMRTAQRLRATARGDHGVAILVGREREACLARLRDGSPTSLPAIKSAA